MLESGSDMRDYRTLGWTELPSGWRCDACGIVLRIRRENFPVRHRCTAPYLSCPHRGDALREVACQLCGGSERMVTIYACALYGECALTRTKSGSVGEVRQCLTCTDLPANAERNAK